MPWFPISLIGLYFLTVAYIPKESELFQISPVSLAFPTPVTGTQFSYVPKEIHKSACLK